MSANAIEHAVDALLELEELERLGPDAESVLRRLQVLAQLNGRPASVRRLAQATSISKSSAGRHAIALADAGLARRVDGGYVAARTRPAKSRTARIDDPVVVENVHDVPRTPEELEARIRQLPDRLVNAQRPRACPVRIVARGRRGRLHALRAGGAEPERLRPPPGWRSGRVPGRAAAPGGGATRPTHHEQKAA